MLLFPLPIILNRITASAMGLWITVFFIWHVLDITSTAPHQPLLIFFHQRLLNTITLRKYPIYKV